jgi:hypothetical protein
VYATAAAGLRGEARRCRVFGPCQCWSAGAKGAGRTYAHAQSRNEVCAQLCHAAAIPPRWSSGGGALATMFLPLGWSTDLYF